MRAKLWLVWEWPTQVDLSYRASLDLNLQNWSKFIKKLICPNGYYICLWRYDLRDIVSTIWPPQNPLQILLRNCCRLMSWCVQYAKIAWCKYQDFMRTFNLSYYPTLKCSDFSFSFCVKYQADKKLYSSLLLAKGRRIKKWTAALKPQI